MKQAEGTPLTKTTHHSRPEVRVGRRLANPLVIEHVYVPDREAMAAALRVVLGFPGRLPDSRMEEGR